MNKHAQTSFSAMGGIFNVTVVGSDFSLLGLCENFILNLERLWSRFEPQSDISRINNAEGKPVSVTRETVDLINLMIEAKKKTHGAYDPTILPLLLKIGYSESHTGSGKKTILPSSARWPGNLEDIEIGTGIVKAPIGTTLDAGGLGKGFAADLLVKKLMDEGAQGALVSASGDVIVDGASIHENGWIIGIEDPFNPNTQNETVSLAKGAVATSSSMKKTFGPSNHHIISPATGKPSNSEIATTTVIAGSGALAELLTKVAFTMDEQAAYQLIESHKAAALIIYKTGKRSYSSNWNKYALREIPL